MYRMIWNGVKLSLKSYKRSTKTSILKVNQYFERKNAEKIAKNIHCFLSFDLCLIRSLIYLFPGIGNEETDAIGFDLALMASSDHTIISRGSFSTWCAILCGGEYYGEYGPIISLTNLINQQDKNHKSKKNSKKRKIY